MTNDVWMPAKDGDTPGQMLPEVVVVPFPDSHATEGDLLREIVWELRKLNTRIDRYETEIRAQWTAAQPMIAKLEKMFGGKGLFGGMF